MTKIHENEKGLWIQAGGYIARPGDVIGYSHAFNMSEGGLRNGDTVKARHLSETQITKVRTADGKILHWHHDANSPHLLPEYLRPSPPLPIRPSSANPASPSINTIEIRRAK